MPDEGPARPGTDAKPEVSPEKGVPAGTSDANTKADTISTGTVTGPGGSTAPAKEPTTTRGSAGTAPSAAPLGAAPETVRGARTGARAGRGVSEPSGPVVGRIPGTDVPAKNEAGNEGPGHRAAKSEPAKNEPAKNESAKNESAKNESAKNEAAKNDTRAESHVRGESRIRNEIPAGNEPRAGIRGRPGEPRVDELRSGRLPPDAVHPIGAIPGGPAAAEGQRGRPGAVTITFPHPLALLSRLAAWIAPPPRPGADVGPGPGQRRRPRRSGLAGTLLSDNLPRAATVAVTILAVVAVILTGISGSSAPASGTDPGGTRAESSFPDPGSLDGQDQSLDPSDELSGDASLSPGATSTASASSPPPARAVSPSALSPSALSPSALSPPVLSPPVVSPPVQQGGQQGPPANPQNQQAKPSVTRPAPLPAAAPSTTPAAASQRSRPSNPPPSPTSGIPARARAAYTSAASQLASQSPTCKLPWTLLAAIGRIESDHGRAGRSTLAAGSGRAVPAIYGVRLDGAKGVPVVRDTDRGHLDADPTYDRAVGPMQFLPGTWPSFAVDADRDGAADPQDVDDAALTAGRYLCTGVAAGTDLSTPAGQWNAAYRYKRSADYANVVLAVATTYATGRAATVTAPPAGASTEIPVLRLTGAGYAMTPDLTTTSTTSTTTDSTTGSTTDTTTTDTTTTDTTTTDTTTTPSTLTVTVTVTGQTTTGTTTTS